MSIVGFYKYPAPMSAEESCTVIDGLVSIITPCYNGGRFLADTVESVLGQTYAQWEMIIVDDGSTDDTPRIAADYAARDGRVQRIRQQNAGTARARNAAMKRARGRYIALLDADDLWEPDFLEAQLAFMRQTGAICVCSAYRHIDEHGREIQHPTVPLSRITPKDMRVMNRIGCLTGLYDARKHGKVYLHEELRSIRDDYAYWYDVVCLEGEARGNPQILARYRVQTSSTTGNKLKLVSKQYHFYRNYLKQSVPVAGLNIVRWGVSGIRKFS